LNARIGIMQTKSGSFETPTLFPVINPTIQLISPKSMYQDFGCEAIITNAYLLKRRFMEQTIKKGIHDFLDFEGVILTDSGAYQILEYGEVSVSPPEIVKYQEEINTDIATILDIPTGWKKSSEYVQYTVDETLKRAKELEKIKTREDIAWIGPIQGGQCLDLVAHSARKMAELPFQIYALGSPTEIMKQYLFGTLVEMILTAKMNLPPERPLHLFGAGHPFMFALVIALGCDSFDSAAYSIYAKDGRYLTERGTYRIKNLKYFPCSCPICTKNTPKDILELSDIEQERIVAMHNLYVSLSEVKRIRQAISEGRLWELLEVRMRGHPSLLQAFKRIKKYKNYLEKQSLVTKKKGLFFFGSLESLRPEVIRHRKRLNERYSKPREADILLLIPRKKTKILHRYRGYERIMTLTHQEIEEPTSKIHICSYGVPFGVIPIELDEVYPLSHYEISTPVEQETVIYVSKQITEYITGSDYRGVILLFDSQSNIEEITTSCKAICNRDGIQFIAVKTKQLWSNNALDAITNALIRLKSISRDSLSE